MNELAGINHNYRKLIALPQQPSAPLSVVWLTMSHLYEYLLNHPQLVNRDLLNRAFHTATRQIVDPDNTPSLIGMDFAKALVMTSPSLQRHINRYAK